jgi:hypothetical protein
METIPTMGAIAERAVDTIAIASGQDGDARRAFGDEGFVVADAGAHGNVTDIDDARAQAHDRL